MKDENVHNVYDNFNNSIEIRNLDINSKEKINQVFANINDDELKMLNLTKNDINNIHSEKEENNIYFSLLNNNANDTNNNTIGIYYLNKLANNIYFIIKSPKEIKDMEN